MLLRYARKQRASVFKPATIDDLPFEVLREAFLYLAPEDLVSPSHVNRSWRPVAQDVQRAQLNTAKGESECMDGSFMCGIQLSRIVFGNESFSIKHLNFVLSFVSQEYVTILARLVSPTLRTLELRFDGERGSASHFAILDQFFSQCHGIRNLELMCFDFGDDPVSISHAIKDGFYQLSQLSLCFCEGDLRMFVVSVPILNLHSFSNLYWHGNSSRDIVSTVAVNYTTIKILKLDDWFNTSTVTLLKFVEFCCAIEELQLIDGSIRLELKFSDIEAIASLPRLKTLTIDCRIEEVGISALSRCKGLKHLAIRGFA
jgi:hypothetical protein